MIRKEYSVKRITKAIRENAGHVLEQEVSTYDQYLTGDVYGYAVEDEKGEDLDSCWGFYGMDYCIAQATEQAKWYADNRVNGAMIDDLQLAV